MCFASGEGDEGTIHVSDYHMAAKRGEMVPSSGGYTNCRNRKSQKEVTQLNCLKLFLPIFRVNLSTSSIVKEFILFSQK